jgi:hypothetical protein
VETAKKSFHGDGLLHAGKRPEDLEDTDKQAIVAPVIPAGLAQPDPSEAPWPPDRKCLHSPPAVEVLVVLAPVDFRP